MKLARCHKIYSFFSEGLPKEHFLISDLETTDFDVMHAGGEDLKTDRTHSMLMRHFKDESGFDYFSRFVKLRLIKSFGEKVLFDSITFI